MISGIGLVFGITASIARHEKIMDDTQKEIEEYLQKLLDETAEHIEKWSLVYYRHIEARILSRLGQYGSGWKKPMFEKIPTQLLKKAAKKRPDFVKTLKEVIATEPAE